MQTESSRTWTEGLWSLFEGLWSDYDETLKTLLNVDSSTLFYIKVGIAAVAAILLVVGTWQLFRRVRRALVRWRASRSHTESDEYLFKHTLSRGERWRIWRLARLRRRYWSADSGAVSPLARKSASRFILKAKSLEVLDRVRTHGRHDVVQLKKALHVPLSRTTRKGIHRELTASKWARKAMKRVVCIMANAGYLPLAHSYTDGQPSYIFHAKAIEETRLARNQTYPHRLPFKPATQMPHLPLGPALMNADGIRLPGPIGPDVVVYIFLDLEENTPNLGPLLYYLDELEQELKDSIGDLRQKDFQIIPDPTIKNCTFGGVDPIQLFGVLKNNAKYMTFDYSRLEPASNTARATEARSAIDALKTILENKQGNHVQATHVELGDILIVNNRRVATAWDEEFSGRVGAAHVGHGDRLVFQMNFYHPGKIPDLKPSRSKIGGKKRKKDGDPAGLKGT